MSELPDSGEAVEVWAGTWLVTDGAAAARTADELAEHGFTRWVHPLPQHPWNLSAERLMLVSTTPSADDVAELVVTAARGVTLILVLDADAVGSDPLRREALIDTLSRVGPVRERSDERPVAGHGGSGLDHEHRRLLDLLAGGASLAEAARTLHVSLRTANRRLSAARVSLSAPSNRAAVLAWKRRGG